MLNLADTTLAAVINSYKYLLQIPLGESSHCSHLLDLIFHIDPYGACI